MPRLAAPLAVVLLTLLAAACGSSEDTVVTQEPRPVVVREPGAPTAEPEPSDPEEVSLAPAAKVPAWTRGAVFYQLFPERFRNGDPTNDPTRASLEFPTAVPANWEVSPWGGDWYAQADWEEEMGGFYDAVFHRRYGGDLQGVIDQLDYLSSLGVQVIYFNPVFWARSLHKYDGNTFHHIDPYFGPDPQGDLAIIAQETEDPETWQWTAADELFLELLQEAKAHNIRIVLDGVFNHTGRDFFAFQDLQERQQDSPYKDWYVVNEFDDPATPDTSEFDYEGWWGVETLPVFADTRDSTDLHPGPKQYVFDATRRWMDPDGDGDPGDGIDGWRLDVAEEVPVGFWEDWNRMVFALNPDAYTVSEVWLDAAEFLEEAGFSSTMNYYGFAFPVKGYLIDGTLAPSRFVAMLNERREAYPTPTQNALLNLVDSHDTDRLASMVVNAFERDGRPYEEPERFDYDWGREVSPRYTSNYRVRAPAEDERAVQRLVALFQMTYVGAPMVYYGTEAGMWGADDPDDRKPMLWSDIGYDPEKTHPLDDQERPADAVAFDGDLFRFYQRAIALRQESGALRLGTFRVLSTDDTAQTLVFERRFTDEQVVVVLNRSGAGQRVDFPAEEGEPFDVLLSTGPADEAPSGARVTGGRVSLGVPPYTGLVLGR